MQVMELFHRDIQLYLNTLKKAVVERDLLIFKLRAKFFKWSKYDYQS